MDSIFITILISKTPRKNFGKALSLVSKEKTPLEFILF